jgi:hypothetical protein
MMLFDYIFFRVADFYTNAFEDKATKTRKGTLIMGYIIFNLLITVGLSIYRKCYL